MIVAQARADQAAFLPGYGCTRFHDKEILGIACGGVYMHRKKINVSTVFAGQKPGIKEVGDGNWLVSFMTYDLGYIDPEQKALQPIDNLFGSRL